MRLKEEYVGATISHNGMKYNLSKMNEEKLTKVYKNVPSLKYIFEETSTEEETFFSNKPEDKTEQEFFEEALAKVGIITPNVTAKRLAEMKKGKK